MYIYSPKRVNESDRVANVCSRSFSGLPLNAMKFELNLIFGSIFTYLIACSNGFVQFRNVVALLNRHL